jgi:hypothetical protein
MAKKNTTHYKISDDKAARMMIALREGRTLRTFGARMERLEAYFAAHTDYAREARPLMEANTKAAHLRKGTCGKRLIASMDIVFPNLVAWPCTNVVLAIYLECVGAQAV